MFAVSVERTNQNVSCLFDIARRMLCDSSEHAGRILLPFAVIVIDQRSDLLEAGTMLAGYCSERLASTLTAFARVGYRGTQCRMV